MTDVQSGSISCSYIILDCVGAVNYFVWKFQNYRNNCVVETWRCQ